MAGAAVAHFEEEFDDEAFEEVGRCGGNTCDAFRSEIPFELRVVTQDEVNNADELMMSSATREVLPIVELDGKPVGQGKPGGVYQRLRAAYDARIAALA